MKVRKMDFQDPIAPVLHLEAETVEEQQFFNRIFFEGIRVVSYNGFEKMAFTCGKDQGQHIKVISP